MTEHIDTATREELERMRFQGAGCRQREDRTPISIPEDREWQYFMRSEDQKTRVQQTIRSECAAIADLLVKKNQDYGNSFADPVQIFSKSDPEEQINVRIDDKLKRLMNRGDKNISEDTEADLIGYLILKRVYRKIKAGKGE